MMTVVTFRKRDRADKWAGETSFFILYLPVLFDFSNWVHVHVHNPFYEAL